MSLALMARVAEVEKRLSRLLDLTEDTFALLDKRLVEAATVQAVELDRLRQRIEALEAEPRRKRA